MINIMLKMLHPLSFINYGKNIEFDDRIVSFDDKICQFYRYQFDDERSSSI